MTLDNTNIIITGGSGYLGEEMGSHLVSCGANVINIGRRQPDFVSGSSSKHIFSDFYDKRSLDESLKAAIKEFGKVDVLVNNSFDFSTKTGFNTPKGRIENITQDIFFSGVKSGIYWPVRCCQLVGEKMKTYKEGNIVNVASLYSYLVPDSRMYDNTDIFNPITYSISKHGLNALTKYLASFWGKHGIRVNALSPGTFPNTKIRKSKHSPNSVDDDDEFLRLLAKKCALGRVGVPSDLNSALEYLVSKKSRALTAANLTVDGGWSIL